MYVKVQFKKQYVLFHTWVTADSSDVGVPSYSWFSQPVCLNAVHGVSLQLHRHGLSGVGGGVGVGWRQTLPWQPNTSHYGSCSFYNITITYLVFVIANDAVSILAFLYCMYGMLLEVCVGCHGVISEQSRDALLWKPHLETSHAFIGYASQHHWQVLTLSFVLQQITIVCIRTELQTTCIRYKYCKKSFSLDWHS